MKKILTFIIIIISINISSQDTNSAKYFPLKTGNKWFYYVEELGYPVHTYSIKTLSILNDTNVNGRKYFKVKGYPFSNIGDTNTVLIRYDSTNGLLKQSSLWAPCNYESILFRLSSQLGDTTGECYSGFSLTCFNISDTTSFNQQTNVKAFKNEQNGHNTNTIRYDFLKNIGVNFINITGTGNPGAFGRIGVLRGFIVNGVLHGDTSSVIGISTISGIIPGTISLSQNYPNPFNPTTKIRFEISGTSVAQTFLLVYDLLGRKVATLVNEELKPGTYEINWDALNFPNGVYFYNLSSGSFSETRKMILIK